MKAIFLIVGIFTFLFWGTPSAYGGEENPEKKAVEQAIRKVVAGGKYKIFADRAYPSGNSSVSLTSGYTLEVRNDSVFSYLPYYGRAYTIPYGGGKGLIFDAPISTYKAEYRKKGRVHIDFTVTNEEDTYQFFIVLFENGSADIRISSANRRPISFKGNLELPDGLR